MLLTMLYRFEEYGHAGPHVASGHATPGDHVKDGGL
jgi:hypothetical protein